MVERLRAAIADIGRGGIVAMARASGIPHNTISRYASGKTTRLFADKADRLEKALRAHERKVQRKSKDTESADG